MLGEILSGLAIDASGINGLTKIDDFKLSNLKDVAIKYEPKDGTDSPVQGLGNIMGKLFATKNASTPGSKTILEEEVAKQPVVEAIFDAQFASTDTHNPNKKVAEVKLESTFATLEALNLKADTLALTNKADKSELLTYDKSGTPTSIKTVAELVTQLKSGADDNGVYTKKGVDDAL